jgi:hypothetical protein
MNDTIKPPEPANELAADLEVAQARITQKMSGHYFTPENQVAVTRPGADDHAEYPSRRGNTLVYLDGRVERIPRP